MITFRHRGNLNKTESFLKNASRINFIKTLEHYAKEGVRALAQNTPIDSGLTADSWGYELKVSRSSFEIVWTNSNIKDGLPIAILIQYGHGLSGGGYIQGRDFINPAMQPIFDQMVKDLYQEVDKL